MHGGREPCALSHRTSSLFLRYLRAPDHPSKLRVTRWLRRLLLRDRLVLTPYGSLTLALDERDFLQRHIMLFGSYEPEVCMALVALARPGDVLWDVGGHVGSFSLMFLSHVQGQVVAFEPDPHHLDVLRLNTAMNALAGRVTSLPVALGQTPGRLPLFLGPDANRGRNSLRVGWATDTRGKVDVEVVRGDELTAKRQVPLPDLMKIDVEGFELDVLRGCSAILERTPPRAIAFEGAADPTGRRPRDGDVERLLIDCGYGIERIGATENWLAVSRTA